jgi:hypothetical protein
MVSILQGIEQTGWTNQNDYRFSLVFQPVEDGLTAP